MAGNMNITKYGTDSIIKLQALVRGYLVRNRFARLRQEYSEIVKCIEGDTAKVRWKNDFKFCLPTVDHESFPTEEAIDVSTNNGQQRITSKTTDLSLEDKLNISNLVEETPVQTCVDKAIKTTDICGNETQNMPMSDGDFESTSTINNFMVAKDCKMTYEESVKLNDLELNSTSNPTNLNTVPVKSRGSQTSNNTETAQEISNHTAADEKGQTESAEERKCDSSNEGQLLSGESMTNSTYMKNNRDDFLTHLYCAHGPSFKPGTDSGQHQTLYPNDKLSLLKLREDLTMELLWIEQAIESRINASGISYVLESFSSSTPSFLSHQLGIRLALPYNHNINLWILPL